MQKKKVKNGPNLRMWQVVAPFLPQHQCCVMPLWP